MHVVEKRRARLASRAVRPEDICRMYGMRFSTMQIDELAKLSEQRGVSRSKLIRGALEDFLKSVETGALAVKDLATMPGDHADILVYAPMGLVEKVDDLANDLGGPRAQVTRLAVALFLRREWGVQ